MSPLIEVHITTATEEEAVRLGEALVDAQLAACAQISGPIRSIYVWEGKKESAQEWVCCLKSRESLFPELVETVRKNHSYQCPQIVAVAIQDANGDYRQWVDAQTRGDGMHRLVACSLLPLVAASLPAGEPFRLGIVGTTSLHVVEFVQCIHASDVSEPISRFRVTAAYPGGMPDNPISWGRVNKIAEDLEKEQGVKLYPTIEAMLPEVDGVLLLSVDGRPHLEQAKPVIAAGKPLYVNKPMAGSLADVFEIFRLAEENKTPIFSSSALRFSAGYQKMRNEKPLGEILGCNVWAPCILNPDARQPDLFWYGVHGSEILFTMMGLGCQTVSRTQTEGGEFVVGVWDGGRIGAFRGIRSGKPDYGAIVFGTEGNGDAGGFDGYKPLVKATCEFFLTNRPPFDSAETIEIFAFMEAADWSKARGGLPVSIAEVIEKAKTETAIPVNLHLSSSGALQLDGKAVELVRLKETLDALAAETPNSRVKVILHADKNTPHETVLAVCNNLGKAILANFLYENK